MPLVPKLPLPNSFKPVALVALFFLLTTQVVPTCAADSLPTDKDSLPIDKDNLPTDNEYRGKDLASVRGDLFSGAFGAGTSKKKYQLQAPVWIDGRQYAAITVRVPNGDGVLLLRFDSFSETFGELVQDATLDRIHHWVVDDYVDARKLTDAGINIHFDARSVSLVAELAPSVRRVRNLNLRERSSRLPGDTFRPARFSSYLNLAAFSVYEHQSSNQEGWTGLRMDLDWVANYRGLVMENAIDFRDNDSTQWRRRGSRLVWDHEETATRYLLGDLQLPIRGFQQFTGLAGVAAIKNYSIQPYRVVRPSGSQQFLLQRTSRVELLVNGRVQKSFFLEPGPYDMDNIARTQGGNNISLRITDSTGAEQILDQFFYVDNDLLKQGLSRFAYAIGAPSQFEKQRLEYDSGNLSFMAYHQYGFTDQFTAGVNVQGDEDTGMLGAEALWGTFAGSFGLRLGVSSGSNIDTDHAAAFDYRFNTADTRLGNFNFSFRANFRGREFTAVTRPSVNNLLRASYGFQVGISQGDRGYLTMGADFQDRREQTNTWGAGVSYRYDFDRNRTMDVSYDYVRDQDGKTDHGLFVAFRWYLDDNNQNLLVSNDTLHDTSRLDWQYLPDELIDSPQIAVSLARDEEDYRGSARMRYDSLRYRANLIHDRRYEDDGSGDRSSRSSLSLSTALVYADGHLGWSQPVNDSFTLFTAHDSLSGYEMGFDAAQGYYSAAIDGLGPGVLYNLQSYQLRRTNLSAPDLPVGLELGQDYFQLLPSYKSGILVTIGTGATVYLEGTIRDISGEIVRLQAGRLESVDGQVPEILLFTNRQGQFRTQGVNPGTYRLVFAVAPGQSGIVQIPPDTTGRYSVGEIQLTRGQNP
jgi:outer membrane usher protein